MIPETFYVSPSKDDTCAHVDPHCVGLNNVVKVTAIPRTDAEAFRDCTLCSLPLFRSQADDPAPDRVECPCGDGQAHRKQPIFEPYQGRRSRPSIQWNYRHSGCWIGGTVVVVNGEAVSKIGPLFEPTRYGVYRDYAAPPDVRNETATAD